MPLSRWDELERLHADWLRRFADHPLADYVRLSRVRLLYFKGDGARAWDELLAMYPRHRERVLGEMRYLVQQSVVPRSIDDARLDWPLRTALIADVRVTPEQWNAYWQATESHAGEPWTISMQERLLWRAIELAGSTRSLPSRFPRRPAAPTPLWAKLRLLALLEAGNLDGAIEQADSTDDSEGDLGAIRVRIHLLRRDWGKALAASPAGDAATRYLVRVLAPQPRVDSLAAAVASPLATDARLTIAGRRAAAGDWTAASRSVRATNPDKARRWARTATLAADTSRSGRLAFARWMRDQHGRLFFGEDTFWLRGLNWRLYALDRDTTDRSAPPPGLDSRLPWTAAEERAKIDAHLRSTTELYLFPRRVRAMARRRNTVHAGAGRGRSRSGPGLRSSRELGREQLAFLVHRADPEPGSAVDPARRLAPREPALGDHGFCCGPRYTTPPFITSFVFLTVEMSRVGSPSTAMRSASRPVFTAPIRSSM